MEYKRKEKRSFKNRMFKKTPIEYCYIQDFEKATKKMCQQCDKDNEIIYSRNMELYMKMKKQLEKKNAIFKIEGPPDPPRKPSNYDLFMIYQNRNLQTNNKIQTIAILYLLQHGYKLVIDPDVEFIPKVMNKENRIFEPYMAIDLAYSLNKDFVDDVAKYYQLNGRTLESPELLSLEEKIESFEQRGINQYLDIRNVNEPRPLSFVERTASSQSAQHAMPSAPQHAMPSAPQPKQLRSSQSNYGLEHTQSDTDDYINETRCYPKLSDPEPPAYSPDNDNTEFGFNQKRQSVTSGTQGEDRRINIIINKN